jgi:hypothetical protein
MRGGSVAALPQRASAWWRFSGRSYHELRVTGGTWGFLRDLPEEILEPAITGKPDGKVSAAETPGSSKKNGWTAFAAFSGIPIVPDT